MAEKKITPDKKIENADWPKRTPDTFDDLDKAVAEKEKQKTR